MGRRSKKSTERRKEIGARLRYIRESRDLTLKQVASRLKPPTVYQTVQKWEMGDSELPIDRLEELAEIYGINPAELLQW